MKTYQITITMADITLGTIHANFTVSAQNRQTAIRSLHTLYGMAWEEIRIRMAHAYAVQFSIKPIRA